MQLSAVWPGQSVSITTPVYPDQSISGKVTSVAPSVDPKTQEASVRVTPDATQRQLRMYPGLQVLVTFRGVDDRVAQEVGGAP
jgi:multidrug efflux pump subunit AcrA (membrane-fusion protein)